MMILRFLHRFSSFGDSASHIDPHFLSDPPEDILELKEMRKWGLDSFQMDFKMSCNNMFLTKYSLLYELVLLSCFVFFYSCCALLKYLLFFISSKSIKSFFDAKKH